MIAGIAPVVRPVRSRLPSAAAGVAAAIMPAMDRSVAWRSALLMGLTVGVIAVVLGATLDESFFRSWGWLAGPGVWAVCALAVASVLRLHAGWTLLGAALSGLPSLVAVLADVHWAGTPLALILFGLWCGRLAARERGSERSRAVTA